MQHAKTVTLENGNDVNFVIEKLSDEKATVKVSTFVEKQLEFDRMTFSSLTMAATFIQSLPDSAAQEFYDAKFAGLAKTVDAEKRQTKMNFEDGKTSK